MDKVAHMRAESQRAKGWWLWLDLRPERGDEGLILGDPGPVAQVEH